MIKGICTFILLVVLLILLIFNTSVTRLGSGFLIGGGKHVITYYDLVKESETLKIKFPNEDDIKVDVVFLDSASNLAILKLKESPKVKRDPLVINQKGLGIRSESVFTLGYPWTNTMEDQHILIEGSANTISKLIELNMNLEPVHSGSPLFNIRQEVIGMVLFEAHAKSIFSAHESRHFVVPALLLEKALKAAKINTITFPSEKVPGEEVSRESFIIKSKNNIVLIEAT